MGREGDSRGTTQISRQKVGHFVPTDISLPYNAGIAVRTTINYSHERLERELQLVSFECNFQQLRCISLAASASLLSSVNAFLYKWVRLLGFIICENGAMSRLGFGLRC